MWPCFYESVILVYLSFVNKEAHESCTELHDVYSASFVLCALQNRDRHEHPILMAGYVCSYESKEELDFAFDVVHVLILFSIMFILLFSVKGFLSEVSIVTVKLICFMFPMFY